MGAVVGYGFALQAYCLEGFDSLGLHQVLRVVCGIRFAFQAERCRFEPCSPLQVLSLRNVNLVDGLIWSQEAVRSNRTVETNFALLV
jgi:hypothetical protein